MDDTQVIQANEEVGHLSSNKMKCRNCGSDPEHHEVRNYSMRWHDGDVHCKLCGAFVRCWDKG